jgi:hypothetical protein
MKSKSIKVFTPHKLYVHCHVGMFGDDILQRYLPASVFYVNMKPFREKSSNYSGDQAVQTNTDSNHDAHQLTPNDSRVSVQKLLLPATTRGR